MVCTSTLIHYSHLSLPTLIGTVAELQSGVTKGTGCYYDAMPVWASDVCEADSTYDGKNRLCSGVNRLFWMGCNDIGGLGGK